MPITVQCSCGKRTTVGDPLAGKTIRCPGCGDELYVPAATAPAKGAKAAKGGKAPGAMPAVSFSGGTVTLVSLLGLVVLAIVIFLAGPKRVWGQWEAIGQKANDDVTSVLEFALQAHLSTHGGYDPGRAHQRPTIDRDAVTFFRPVLVMSMPDKVKFKGKSSQGNFEGFYHPKTGEIEAEMATGGMSFAGMVDLAKSTGSFSMTGRMGKDGQPQAESGGQKLALYFPPHPDE